MMAVEAVRAAMIPARTRRSVLRRDQYRCAFCAETNQQHQRETAHSASLHLHHIIPRQDGGDHSKRNLIALCDDCHAQIEADTRAKLRGVDDANEVKSEIRAMIWSRARDDHPIAIRAHMAARVRARS
jgi:5-methylcytosine-specific restriction endonuclease McrA